MNKAKIICLGSLATVATALPVVALSYAGTNEKQTTENIKVLNKEGELNTQETKTGEMTQEYKDLFYGETAVSIWEMIQRLVYKRIEEEKVSNVTKYKYVDNGDTVTMSYVIKNKPFGDFMWYLIDQDENIIQEVYDSTIGERDAYNLQKYFYQSLYRTIQRENSYLDREGAPHRFKQVDKVKFKPSEHELVIDITFSGDDESYANEADTIIFIHDALKNMDKSWINSEPKEYRDEIKKICDILAKEITNAEQSDWAFFLVENPTV